MRRILAGTITALTGLACAAIAACSASSSGGGVDASSAAGDDAASGVTCYNLASAGDVTVATADACKVLASGVPGASVPGQAPAGLIVSKYCDLVCRPVHGDNFCVVDPAYVTAYEQANKPADTDAGDDGGAEGGAEAGAEAGAPDAGASGCPAAPGAGGVKITCYTEMPYNAPVCPK